MKLKKISQYTCVISLLIFIEIMVIHYFNTRETVEQSLSAASAAMEQGKDHIANIKILQAALRVFTQNTQEVIECQVIEPSQNNRINDWCTTDNENERKITQEIKIAVNNLKQRGYNFKQVALLFYPDTTFKKHFIKQNELIKGGEILKKYYPQAFAALEDAKDSSEENIDNDIDTQYESALTGRANIIHIEEWPNPKSRWTALYDAVLDHPTDTSEDTRQKVNLHTRFALYHEYGHYLDQKMTEWQYTPRSTDENNFQQEAFADLFAASMLAKDYKIDMKKIILGLAEMRKTKENETLEDFDEHDVGGFLARLAEYPLENMSIKKLHQLSKARIVLVETNPPLRSKREILREKFGLHIIPAKIIPQS